MRWYASLLGEGGAGIDRRLDFMASAKNAPLGELEWMS
jgi:hypothetical protein